MVDQSQHQALVYGITIHTFIMGQPYRLRRFRQAMEHLVGLPGVWLTTPGEIASHYAGITPAEAALSGVVTSEVTRVAIAGLGAVGRVLVARLAEGLPGIELSAVVHGITSGREQTLHQLGVEVPVRGIAELEPLADLVVECAPAHLLPSIAEPFLRAGKEVVVLSAGALLEHEHLIELAKLHGGRISVPTGALLGLDAVAAAAEVGITSLRLTTRKPPAGLIGAPGLEASGIDLDGLKEPRLVFSGTARQVVRGFPANLNVAVALVARRPGPGQHPCRGLGRSGGHQEHPHNRHDIRGCRSDDDHRKRPLREPAHGPHHAVVGDFTAQEAERHSEGWLVNLGRSRLVDCQ